MEEINLADFLRYYISKLVFVIITVVAIVIIGNVYHILCRVPLYQSNTTIVLAKELKEEQTYTQSDLLLNQNLVATYSQIIKSRNVLEQVIRDEHLEYSVAELSSRVTVSSVEDTEIIKITVSDADAVRAKNVANAIVPVFSEKVKQIYNIDNVNVVESAMEAEQPYNIRYGKENMIYILVGFFASSAVLFMIYYFDTSIKSIEVIEDKFDLTVLGVVPMVDRG